MAKKPFEPALIGTCRFANGLSFSVTQITEKGACAILNLRTGDVNKAGSISAAFRSIKFQGKVRPDTNNTHGWPKNEGAYY